MSNKPSKQADIELSFAKTDQGEFKLIPTNEIKEELDSSFVSKKPPNSDNYIKAFMILFAIGIKVWQPLAISASRREDGKYNYNKTTMVILVELAKLIVCGSALIITLANTEGIRRRALTNLKFRESLHFLVPAVFYAGSNTLVYYGLSYIDPALFHVFGNIRIITAGVLYRIIMGKKLSDIQWLSLILLTCGAVLATPGVSEASFDGSKTFVGLLFITLMCLLSTSASIYTEMYFKKTKELSIWYQNSVLYIYGIIVNAIYLFYTEESDNSQPGVFEGWDIYTFQVLFVQSTMGLSLSFLFKFLDNIIYVISLTVSMFITAFLSSILFEFEFNLAFICALVVVTAAIYLYNRSKILEKYDIDEKNFNL
ncbi:unnamed protein product [Blepharisma stoltei]|uniref:Uncharacterized protein n=1 Tax=Blepharisma stoltei TaxID=1481888 RepID=A0AAU9JNP4_9CILI|nr:unnamed protein product [Blepharisma stoltei]